MPTRTIAYLRVSTDKQADRGVSLDAQRAKVKAYAELYDFGTHRADRRRGSVSMSPRSVLANDIMNLRNYTNAPNSSLKAVINLNKELFPETFAK
jgi:DNA invertase Pin-like site-specific DNA recombinase